MVSVLGGGHTPAPRVRWEQAQAELTQWRLRQAQVNASAQGHLEMLVSREGGGEDAD